MLNFISIAIMAHDNNDDMHWMPNNTLMRSKSYYAHHNTFLFKPFIIFIVVSSYFSFSLLYFIHQKKYVYDGNNNNI
jgi:hypothetical protein